MSRVVKPLLLGSVVLGGLLLDLSTKSWAARYLARRGPIQVIGGLLELRYSENTAVAFSLLRSIPSEVRLWVICLLNVAGLAGLGYLVFRWWRRKVLELIPLILIIGGAAGNLYERLTQGYVVDFLHLHYRYQWSWPVFNVADSLIFLGVVLFVLMGLKEREDRSREAPGRD